MLRNAVLILIASATNWVAIAEPPPDVIRNGRWYAQPYGPPSYVPSSAPEYYKGWKGGDVMRRDLPPKTSSGLIPPIDPPRFRLKSYEQPKTKEPLPEDSFAETPVEKNAFDNNIDLTQLKQPFYRGLNSRPKKVPENWPLNYGEYKHSQKYRFWIPGKVRPVSKVDKEDDEGENEKTERIVRKSHAAEIVLSTEIFWEDDYEDRFVAVQAIAEGIHPVTKEPFRQALRIDDIQINNRGKMQSVRFRLEGEKQGRWEFFARAPRE